MTMARVKDGKVVAVGVFASLADTSSERLYQMGWRILKGTPKPADGQKYEYASPYTFDADEDCVFGTWNVVPESFFTDQSAKAARGDRDALLEESDWTQVADAPVDQQPWAVYRQALRDVPQQTGFPSDVTWPTKPE